MIIWVGANGFLDDLPVEAVGRFEREFYSFMRNKHPEVGKAISQKRDLTDEIVAQLKQAAQEFKAMFAAK